MTAKVQANAISIENKTFSVDGYTFSVQGNGITHENLKTLQKVFSTAGSYLELLNKGRTREQPLSILLITEEEIFKRQGFGTGGYYQSDINLIALPKDKLTERVTRHELEHAIDDMLYVDSRSDWDTVFDSDRFDHPIRLAENQMFCDVAEINEYRSLVTLMLERNVPNFDLQPLVASKEKLIRQRGIKDPYFCFDERESIAVANYYTGDISVTGLKKYFSEIIDRNQTEKSTLIESALDLYNFDFLSYLYSLVLANDDTRFYYYSLGKQSDEDLINGLYDPSPEIRKFTAILLRQMRADDNLCKLASVYAREENENVKAAFLESLKILVGHSSIPVLLKLLGNADNPDVIGATILELQKRPQQELKIEASRSYLLSTNLERQKLGERLYEYFPELLILSLVNSLNYSYNSDVDQRADEYFFKKLQTDPVLLIEGLRESYTNSPYNFKRMNILKKMSILDSSVFGLILMERLKNDHDPAVQLNAAYFLADTSFYPAVPILQKVMSESNDHQVQVACYYAIRKIGWEGTALSLAKILCKETDPIKRRNILIALGIVGDKNTFITISAHYRRNVSDRKFSSWALANIDPAVKLKHDQ